MNSLNRLGLICMSAALAVGFSGFAQKATAIVIYHENFAGLSTDNLNGKAPDVDNTASGTDTWLAYNAYKQNGALPGGTGQNVNRGAWLPFVPQAGNVYTLSASLTGVVASGTNASTNFAWYALGFGKSLPSDVQTSSNRFNEGEAVGRAWMLFRPNNTSANLNQSHRGSGTSGTGPAGTPQPWATGSPSGGGDVDLQIVLDTTVSTWTVTYYANRPGDPLLMVSPGALPLLSQTDLGIVGICRTTDTAANSSMSGKVTSFDLSVEPVPEPASCVLLALGVITLGVPARRKR